MSDTTTEVTNHLKDEGVFTFQGIYQQLRDGTPDPISHEQRTNDASDDFTVPVCDEQTCQLEIPKDIDHTTSMSNSQPQERPTVPSTGPCGEMRPAIASNFKDLWVNSQEYSAECETRFSPPGKILHDSYECSKDDTGKSRATQDELYLAWNAQSQFENELMNKGKSSVCTSKAIHFPPHRIQFEKPRCRW